MAVLRSLYIDDRDPAIIYSSDRRWKLYTGENTEFMLTTSHADQAGANARITFTGSDISVFGSISAANFSGGADPLTHYILDSNPPFPFRPLPNNDTQYNVMFYQSPKNLGPGLHTLQIALQSAGSYWLDYIVISGNTSISAVDTATTPTTAIENVHTHTVYSEQPFTLLSTITATPTPVTSSVPSGAIVASGILGGVLGVILIVCLSWFVYQRRTSKHLNDVEDIVSPYTASTFGPFAGPGSIQTRQSEVTSQPTLTIPSRSKNRITLATIPNFEPPPVYYSPRILGVDLRRDL